MNEYVITYLDSRDGTPRQVTIKAEDSGEAVGQAMDDDYYFGILLRVEGDD